MGRYSTRKGRLAGLQFGSDAPVWDAFLLKLFFCRPLSPSNRALSDRLLGQIDYQKGEFEQALISFEEALKSTDSNPMQAMIHAALGATLLELNRLDRALQEYDAAFELDPTGNDINSRLGKVYFELQQYDKAIEYLEKAGEDDAFAVIRLADTYWNKGDQDKSIAILSEASKTFDAIPEVYDYLGFYLFETERYEEAIKILEKALSLSKDFNEKTLCNLGNAHYELGYFDEALEIYQKVITLFPQNAFTYRRIGFIYYEQDRLDDAVKIWQQMVEIDVDDPIGSHRTLAFGYRARGDFEAALNEIRQAISLAPTDGTVYTTKGIILEDMDKQKEALEAFEHAIRLGDEFSLLNLAEIHHDLGHFDEAVHYAEVYVEAAKNNEELEPYLEDALKIIKAVQ